MQNTKIAAKEVSCPAFLISLQLKLPHSQMRRVIVLRCSVIRHLSDIDSNALGHFFIKNLIG